MKIKIIFMFFLTITALKAEDFKAVTIKKDTVNLMEYAEDKNLFIILYTTWNACFDCFEDILESLDSLKHKDKNIRYVFLGKSDNSSLARRRQIETISQIKDSLIMYFDINENIFNKYKVSITPAIININALKINYISFDAFVKQKHNYYKVLKKYTNR